MFDYEGDSAIMQGRMGKGVAKVFVAPKVLKCFKFICVFIHVVFYTCARMGFLLVNKKIVIFQCSLTINDKIPAGDSI